LPLVPRPAAAYFDPGFQRWLNRDPAAQDSGSNLYVFLGDDPENHLDFFGLRSCKEICAAADQNPKIIVQDGQPSMGGVVCDSDGTKCPCPFSFPVPGQNQGGEFYHPGECPALDDILTKHEKEGHFNDTDCPKNRALCRAEDKPGVDSNKADCQQWKKDMKRLHDAIFDNRNSGRCARIMTQVLELTAANYNRQCAGR
jgi:hypothetical protein